MDLALNNQQKLICYETQPTNQHLSISEKKKTVILMKSS